MRRVVQIAVLAAAMLSPSRVWAATYYIDFVGGADTNSGTSKLSAWKHAPGMNGCANLCASATPVAGDSIVLKGGVTWPNASLGWNWHWSGAGTTYSPGCGGTGCIYIGVDPTWFSGGAWTRPILNAGGSAVADPGGGVANVLLRIYANYVIVDNLEFTGVFWTGTPAYGTGVNIALAGGTPGVGTNVEIKNNYIHGWSHGSAASGTHENPCGIIGDTGIPNNNANSIAHDNVVDGSDTDHLSCSAFFGGPPYIVNNYMRWVTNCAVVNGAILFSGNSCLNVPRSFDTTAHTNGLEVNASRNVIISNNVIAHLGTGTLGIWCAPYPGYTCTIFNNLMFDTDTGNVLDIAPPVYTAGNCTPGTPPYCTQSGTTNVYNNTIECGQDVNPNSVCVGGITSGATAVSIRNNHFITNATSPNGGIWSSNGPTPTLTTNLIQTKSAATAAGFTSGQPYPFFPTSGVAPTVGVGTNLTSLCSTFSPLCQDASLGVALNSSNHTVSGPARPPVSRPSIGAWSIGAYNFVPTPPVAPTGVVILP